MLLQDRPPNISTCTSTNRKYGPVRFLVPSVDVSYPFHHHETIGHPEAIPKTIAGPTQSAEEVTTLRPSKSFSAPAAPLYDYQARCLKQNETPDLTPNLPTFVPISPSSSSSHEVETNSRDMVADLETGSGYLLNLKGYDSNITEVGTGGGPYSLPPTGVVLIFCVPSIPMSPVCGT